MMQNVLRRLFSRHKEELGVVYPAT